MKTKILVPLILTIVIAALTATTVSAYSGTQIAAASNSSYGFGGRGGYMGNASNLQDGILHDAILSVFSENLGISAEELDARLDAGESMSEIALSEGLTLDEFETLMDEARATAIDQEVSDGLLTQAQADALKQNSNVNSFGNAAMMRGNSYNRGLYGTGICIY